MLATPDQQMLTDRSRIAATRMATSGRVFRHRRLQLVQIRRRGPTDHLIVMHEVTNDGTDRSQLSRCSANETKTALGVEKLDAVADRSWRNSEEILACEVAGITVTAAKGPMTLGNAKAEGRFGKQDFRYVCEDISTLVLPARRLAYHYTTEENEIAVFRRVTMEPTYCR